MRIDSTYFKKACLLFALMLPLLTIAAKDEEVLRQVSLQLKWKHQFQFAGYYAAIEQGYFKEAGLAVNLIEAVDNHDPNEAVFQGDAEFGISSSEVLLLRSKQNRPVILASVFQHSPLVLLMLEKSGIKHARDLIGKRIALEPNSGELIAFLKSEGVSLNDVVLSTQSFDLKQLINGDVDAISAYSTDETFLLEEEGIAYSVLSPMMSGLDFYGDVLFTTDKLIKSDPELVRKFREAALKGWKYAQSHQQETIDLIYNKYSQRHSKDYLLHEAEHMKSLVLDDVVEIGYSNPDRWQHILDMLKGLNLIDKSVTNAGLLYSDYSDPLQRIPWNIILILCVIILVVFSVSYFFYYTTRKLRIEIKNRQKIQNELRLSEGRYLALFQNSNSIILLIDPESGKILDANPAACSFYGWTKPEMENLTITDINTLPLLDVKAEMQNSKDQKRKHFNFKHRLSSGEIRDVEVFSGPLQFGDVTMIYSIIYDVTDRKITEGKILKANRFYAFISKINQSIVLIKERDLLLKEVCRIAVEVGHFQMAWVGFIDEATMLVKPIVFAGHEDGYLSKIKNISVGDVPEGNGPTGNAIRAGKHFCCDDIENDPRMALWKNEALSRGYHSSIAIPIKQLEKVIGALMIYSSEANFFDSEEIELLIEVTDNISFALDVIEKDKEIKDLYANLELKIAERTVQLEEANKTLLNEIEEKSRVENALLKSEQNYKAVVENIKEVIFFTDTEGLWLFLNKSWTEITGFSVEESIGQLFLNYVHPDDRERNMELFLPLLKREKDYCKHEVRYIAKDGGIRWIEVFARLGVNDQNEVIGTYGTLRDITDSKLAEDFENELLQLSPKLTGLPLAEIDDAINLAISRIGHFLAADRSYIFEVDEVAETMSNTFEWCNEGINPEINNLKNLPYSTLPNWMELLHRNQNIVVPSMSDLPPSMNIEREILERQGIQSLITIPMFSENVLIGFVGLDSVRNRREYSNAEINILIVWSRMLASLINNRKAELLLEQTRQNYETFFNTIDDFLWVFDENARIIHVNDTVRNRLGYTGEELMNQSVMLVHPPERGTEAQRIVGEMLVGKASFCPVPLVTKSGTPISVETRVKAGFWDNKPVFFGISKDMSMLELSEQKFSKAFQSNSAMMSISIFENGYFIDANNAFVETTGYDREEIIGKTSSELGLFEDSNIRQEILRDLNNNIPVRKKEIKIITKNGNVRVGLLSADSIFVGDMRCLLIVTTDITERIKSEEEIRNARSEAEKANLAKSEFLSRMSHELRTPMNSILGFAQLLNMGDLNPGQKKGVNHIMRSGKHLLDLINEVLDISRIEAGRLSLSLEPVQVNEVIVEMMELVRHQAAERNVKLELVSPKENLLYIKSDKQRIKQILLNLITNAIKYNRKDGAVFVETNVQAKNEAGIVPVRISIRDNGMGIAEEDIPKLFNPFERIGAEKTETEGTGLGLSVTKKLVDAMGGTIGVESVLGSGSTFWVEFPLSEKYSDEKVGMLGSLEQKLTNKSGLILYIEDNASNVELVVEILETQRSDIRLLTDPNGLSTVPLATEYKPDLILLDLNLPDIHGSEVLKSLQNDENTRNIPVVVISADAMPQQIERLLEAGAKRYITKPLDLNLLLKIIDEFVD